MYLTNLYLRPIISEVTKEDTSASAVKSFTGPRVLVSESGSAQSRPQGGASHNVFDQPHLGSKPHTTSKL